MSKEISLFVKAPNLATSRVKEYSGVYKKREIANLLDISRQTFYARIKKHNWTMAELQRISEHFPELSN